jgi:DNA-binding NarL/FixJ family response regulator
MPGRSHRRGWPSGGDLAIAGRPMIKILVADDHPVVRDGLRALFAEYPDIALIGEAATGREAIKAAVIDQPDVIIMDLAMPDTDGFSATAEINRVAPEVAVLILTMSDDDVTVTKAMRAGARGYLLKGATKEEILRAVTAVADGQAIFGPSVAQRVLARLGAPATGDDPFPQLTPREHDVLRLLSQGLSNSAIADRFGLSLKTINNNTSAIFTKLNVATRTEAAILARDRGLG